MGGSFGLGFLPFRVGMKLANNDLHYLHGVLAGTMIASHMGLVPDLDGNIA